MKSLTAVSLALGLASAMSLGRQAPEPTLAVLSPKPDDVVSGLTHFAAEVRPAELAVSQVEFFLDGALACRSVHPPFDCAADVGHRGLAASVRAVALLADGRRLVQTVRTKAPGLVISSETDAVLVTAHVIDSHGRFVHGLTEASFRILEDGQPQEIGSFSDEDAASTVLLALDMSGSMAVAVADLKAAAAGFLGALRSTDAVTVAAFNTNLFVLAEPGVPVPARLSALERLAPTGMTALYDVIIQATNLVRHGQGRRAIVVFTDGDDDASRSSLESVRTTLESSDVVLYLIARGKAAQDENLRRAWAGVATATGGDAYFGPNMSHLSEHFADIRDELASGYLLGYTPKRPLGDGAWRKLTVTVSGPGKGDHVQAREGYLATSRAGGAH
jgi:Ca-activated chloride channel family protein